MDISPEGIARIQAFEGLKLTAYQCSADKWTIGYGHTAGVKAGDTMPPGQAEAFLREDITLICLQLDILLKVTVRQNQFDALGSLLFNIGVKAFAHSTLLGKLNAGDEAGAAAEFPKWCYGTVKGKKVALRGLMARRQQEKARFEAVELSLMKAPHRVTA
ncbi:lysozyme [Candidatus Hamiltonella defensa]|uniref:lysozyme n=1 Tax=Candidatus Williamhamiltonella defendens TaxID=138072 RepID=UPI0015822B92|nr:lysozyme [Candidatus Hamiltonella defensa]